MDIELSTSRVIGIYAPQKYGKTFITHYFLEEYMKHVEAYLYDTDLERHASYRDLRNLNFVYPIKKTDIEKEESVNKAILTIRSKKTNCIIAIEDIDKLMQNKTKTKTNSELYKIASDSRHQRIALLYNSKTPSYIPTTLRLNTNLFLFGKFIEPLAVDYITSIIPKELYAKIHKPEFVFYDVWTQNVGIIKYDVNKNEILDVIK